MCKTTARWAWKVERLLQDKERQHTIHSVAVPHLCKVMQHSWGSLAIKRQVTRRMLSTGLSRHSCSIPKTYMWVQTLTSNTLRALQQPCTLKKSLRNCKENEHVENLVSVFASTLWSCSIKAFLVCCTHHLKIVSSARHTEICHCR